MPMIQSVHPENNYDVTIQFEESGFLLGACYDDQTDVKLTPAVKESFRQAIRAALDEPEGALLSSGALATTHHKNGFDVVVTFDENRRLIGASYDDGDEVDLTPAVKAHLQSDIDQFVVDQ